jgi:hypothetical protein
MALVDAHEPGLADRCEDLAVCDVTPLEPDAARSKGGPPRRHRARCNQQYFDAALAQLGDLPGEVTQETVVEGVGGPGDELRSDLDDRAAPALPAGLGGALVGGVNRRIIGRVLRWQTGQRALRWPFGR